MRILKSLDEVIFKIAEAKDRDQPLENLTVTTLVYSKKYSCKLITILVKTYIIYDKYNYSRHIN